MFTATDSSIVSEQGLSIADQQILADPRYKAYQPYGSALETLYYQGDEMLICGPVGTGKSRGALEKLHLCCCKYPKMRALLVRKTRSALTQSAIVTYENFVLPDNGMVKFRTYEQEYRYQNGSKIVIGGMDKSSKIMSSEYDLIFVMEARELTLEDWEALITRNRYGVMPYNQIIGDCNPGPPRHWLYQRTKGKNAITKYIKSIHEDNPTLWNHITQQWTVRGKAYLKKLNNLTGVRKLRLLKGIWAAAEGMIYEDEWDEEIHLVDRFKIPKLWTRVWFVAFGYQHPFVWQAWAIDPDGVAYRFGEIYHTRRLVEDMAAEIRAWQNEHDEPNPYMLVCDWDAEDRATLERHLDVETMPANKAVLAGINSVKTRLKVRGNGKAGMYFLRDSVIEVDLELQDSALPVCTEHEFEGYIWKDNSIKEQPVKKEDHGMDLVRYLSMFLDDETLGWTQGMGA